MSSFLYLLSVVCAANFNVTHAEDKIKPPQIINGNEAELSDYPWQASLQVHERNGNYYHHCGGSLISEKWILTAAHCCYDRKRHQLEVDMVKVILGTRYRNKADARSQQLFVNKMIEHDQYNMKAIQNDIALWRLKRKAVIVPHQVEIIYLPLPGERVNKRADVTITGWGLIEAVDVWYRQEVTMCGYALTADIYEKQVIPTLCGDVVFFFYDHVVGIVPYTLREAQVPVAQYCEHHFICLGNNTYTACSGDSGGPMVQKVNGQWKQFGVASKVAGAPLCQLGDGTSYYTDVSDYIGWINEHL